MSGEVTGWKVVGVVKDKNGADHVKDISRVYTVRSAADRFRELLAKGWH